MYPITRSWRYTPDETHIDTVAVYLAYTQKHVVMERMGIRVTDVPEDAELMLVEAEE